MMTQELKDLAGGMKPEELSALRRLQAELEGAGYEVREVALSGGGRPAAIVARREDSKSPIRTLVAACRSLLRASEGIEDGEKVSPEEAETMAAARLTLRVAQDRTEVKNMKTIGENAHLDMANAVDAQEDVHDED